MSDSIDVNCTNDRGFLVNWKLIRDIYQTDTEFPESIPLEGVSSENCLGTFVIGIFSSSYDPNFIPWGLLRRTDRFICCYTIQKLQNNTYRNLFWHSNKTNQLINQPTSSLLLTHVQIWILVSICFCRICVSSPSNVNTLTEQSCSVALLSTDSLDCVFITL